MCKNTIPSVSYGLQISQCLACLALNQLDCLRGQKEAKQYRLVVEENEWVFGHKHCDIRVETYLCVCGLLGFLYGQRYSCFKKQITELVFDKMTWCSSCSKLLGVKTLMAESISCEGRVREVTLWYFLQWHRLGSSSEWFWKRIFSEALSQHHHQTAKSQWVLLQKAMLEVHQLFTSLLQKQVSYLHSQYSFARFLASSTRVKCCLCVCEFDSSTSLITQNHAIT